MNINRTEQRHLCVALTDSDLEHPLDRIMKGGISSECNSKLSECVNHDSTVVQNLTNKNNCNVVSDRKNIKENEKVENKLEIIVRKENVDSLTKYQEHKMNDPLWNIKLKEVRKLDDHLEVKLDSDKKEIDKLDLGKVKVNKEENSNEEKKLEKNSIEVEKNSQRKENWLELTRRK